MTATGRDSLRARRTLEVGGLSYDYFALAAAAAGLGRNDLGRLPYTLKILLENLLRREDGRTVAPADIEAVARWLDTRRSCARSRSARGAC